MAGSAASAPGGAAGDTDARIQIRSHAGVYAARVASSAAGTDSPAKLRGAMVDHWRTYWRAFAAPVESAMRTVPRHLFLPAVSADDASPPDPFLSHRPAQRPL